MNRERSQERNNQENSSRGTHLFLTCCLIAGGIALLTTVIYLLQNLTDDSFINVGIPGFITAICLFLIYGLGMRTVEKQKK